MALTGFNAHGAEPRRVLLLHSFGREFEPFITFSQTFRSELAKQSPEPLDLFDVALASARFDASEEAPFVDYLLALFAGRRVDLVVPMGGPACRFAQEYRAKLFPDTPLLLACVEQRMLQSLTLSSNDAVLSVRHDPQFMVEAILRLLPATTNVVIVFGNSPLEKFWTEEFKRAIDATQVGSEAFSELSFSQMKRRAAALPPRSVMIYGQVLVDADGVPHTVEHSLRNLHAVANAPIFGIHDFQLGHGIVGGPLISVRDLSHRSASVAARILQGEAPAGFRPPPVGPGTPIYDWRELRHWKIAERTLPPGSTVLFRERTLWQRYRGWIITGLSVLAVEGAIIASLLVNLIKRRRAEETLRNIAAGVSAKTGETFFQSLAEHISGALQVEYAFVCEVCKGGWCARTIASYVNGEVVENVEYALAGTPCEQVLRLGMAAYPHGIQKTFPEDKMLVEMGAEGYLGVCLKDSGGKALGLMAVLSRKPLVNVESAKSMLSIFAARASAELERKHAEDRLRAREQDLRVSEERYREVVESQTDLVCRFLADGTLTFVNTAYCRFFGYPREKMIGRKFYEFLPEKTHEAAKEFVAVLNLERRPLAADHEVVLPDGTIGWQHWVDYPILGPDGEVTEFQAIGRDITDRKRAEAADLKLTHATRLAMVGELTGMVVHDLSQPLSAVLCNARAAELILQNSDPPPLKEICDILAGIRNDSQRASETVRQMRSLLRQRQLELKPLDLSGLIAEVLHIVSGEAARRRIQIKTELAAEFPLISGDRVHLQQVLLNLILNGMDAMENTPESERRLLVRTGESAYGIEVMVSDTGQGIPFEGLPHLFDSFFTTKKEGLGLGLSICKWIVEAHRGRILAENDANGGATFRFTLPINNAAA